MTEDFLNSVDSDTQMILESEFTEPITIRYIEGNTEVTMDTTCIFDKTYTEIDNEGSEVMSNYSRATVWEKEIEAEIYQPIDEDEDNNWRATVRSVNYFIKHVERDGTGIALLTLKKSDA